MFIWLHLAYNCIAWLDFRMLHQVQFAPWSAAKAAEMRPQNKDQNSYSLVSFLRPWILRLGAAKLSGAFLRPWVLRPWPQNQDAKLLITVLRLVFCGPWPQNHAAKASSVFLRLVFCGQGRRIKGAESAVFCKIYKTAPLHFGILYICHFHF